MIISRSISTNFESIIIFWGSIENWLEPKIESTSANLACPNRETPCRSKRFKSQLSRKFLNKKMTKFGPKQYFIRNVPFI